MAETVERAFASLVTKDGRRNALHKVVRAMSCEERQYFLAFLLQQNDPLFTLPVELVLHIFDYLPVFCTWTLQRVSRRWRDLLSSDDSLRSALLRWQTHGEAGSARSAEQFAASSPESKLRHLKSLRTGVPLSTFTIYDNGADRQELRPIGAASKLALRGSRLAYIASHCSSRGNAIIIRNLITGQVKVLHGIARERAMHLVITSSLLAWITFDADLYVSYHADPSSEVDWKQLPSARVRHFTACGNTVVLLMGATAIPPDSYISQIVVYEALRRRLRSFDVTDKFRDLEVGGWRSISSTSLLDGSRHLINVFVLMSNSEPMAAPSDTSTQQTAMKLVHVRFSLSGQWLHSTSTTRQMTSHVGSILRQNPQLRLCLASPHATGYREEYRIVVQTVPRGYGEVCRFQFAVLFNAESETMTYIEHNNEDRQRVMTEDGARDMDILWKGQSHRPQFSEDWREEVFDMNDTFLVSLEAHRKESGRRRIRVLCFDPDVRVPDPRKDKLLPLNDCNGGKKD